MHLAFLSVICLADVKIKNVLFNIYSNAPTICGGYYFSVFPTNTQTFIVGRRLLKKALLKPEIEAY